MSGAGAGNLTSSNPPTTKSTVPTDTNQDPALPASKPATHPEEDDEFEDFPVEDWGDEDTDLGATSAEAATGNGAAHLWEESWDDDDTSEEFAAMLKEELTKVEGAKR